MTDRSSSWPAEMDAAARVRHVALTRTRPRNAGWIASEADVSRDTAVKYLERMADRGDLEVVETSDGTCYRPDDVTQFLRDVRLLASEYSIDELTAELADIAAEIDDWKGTYEVDSLTELRQSLGDEDRSAAARRDRLEVVEEWAYEKQTREAIQLAIALKQSLSELEADPGIASTDTERLPQEG